MNDRYQTVCGDIVSMIKAKRKRSQSNKSMVCRMRLRAFSQAAVFAHWICPLILNLVCVI
jgi:hypothetical protein